MNTRDFENDELDALLAAALTPYREVAAPRRTWKRLLHRMMWSQSPLHQVRFWLTGWGTPALVSPDAPQPLAKGVAGWIAPPSVGAMVPRLQTLRLTS